MVRIIIIEGIFYLWTLEDYEKAISDFTSAIDLDPDDAYYYFYRGDAYSNNGQYNKALGSYLKAEEFDKDKSLAKTEGLYNNMAVNFSDLGQSDKALEYYTKEIEINPNYYLGYKNIARIYAYDLKDYEKAEADYTKAIELDPENDDNYYSRGYFYLWAIEDYEKAISDFTSAIDLDPDDAHNYFYRGDAYSNNGQYNKALGKLFKGRGIG